MGVYTRFSLRVHPPERDAEIRAALVKASGYCCPFIEDVEAGHDYINGGDGPKWYSARTDISAVASINPDVTIYVATVCEDYETAAVTTYRGASVETKTYVSDPRDLFKIEGLT